VNEIVEGRAGRPAPQSLRRSAGHGQVAACLTLLALAMSACLAPAAAAAGSGVRTVRVVRRARSATTPVSSVVRVTVPAQKAWTDTGIALRTGESVVVRGSGSAHFGGGRIARLGPAGIAWGQACTAIAKGQARTSPWPAPGLRCWSLIGKVGAGAPFEVGTQTSFRVLSAGELSLGVNDNYIPDNFGTFAVTVTVSSLVAPSPTPTKAAKTTTSTTGLIVGAVVAAFLLGFGFWLVAARRRRRRPEPADGTQLENPESAVVDTPTTDASPPPPNAETEPPSVFAPPEADSIDVNIFDVEFSNGLVLRVGYNHFPEGTPLRWRVSQNRALAATGDFVTKGGGSTNHLETIPLGVKLQGRDLLPDGADVEFEWSINGVPFRYSVRRDPNC